MKIARRLFFTRQAIWLTVIASLSAAMSVYFASNIPATSDEGLFVYQAKQIIDGAIPFREIYTQSPVFLWLISISQRVFGYNLFAGRILSIITSEICIFFIYLIGKELYSRRVGLVASAVFAFGPTVILHDLICNYRPVSYSMVTIATYLLVLAIKRDKGVYYGLFGSILGIAVWTYRGIFSYVLVFAPFILYIYRSDLKSATKNMGLMASGGLVTFGLIFCYLASNSSLEFINYAWGFAPASGSTTKFIYLQRPEFSVIGRVSSMENFLDYSRFHSRILYVISRDWLYLVTPSFLFVALVVKERMAKRNRSFWLLLLGFSLMFAFVIAAGIFSYPKGDYGTYEVTLVHQILFIVEFGALLFFGIIATSSNVRYGTQVKFADTFLISWLMAVGLTLFLLPIVHAFYALSLNAVGSLMAGVILDLALVKIGTKEKGSTKQKARARRIISFENWHNFTFILLFVFSMATIASSLVSRLPIEFYTPLSTAKEIGEYIEARTSLDDEIFTGQATFAVYANRCVALDMPNFYVYRTELLWGEPFPTEVDRYGAAPSIEQLLMRFKAGKIRYVILGDPNGDALVKDIAELKFIIDNFYEKEADIGGFTIYRLSGEVVLGDF